MEAIRKILFFLSAKVLLLSLCTTTSLVQGKRWAFVCSLPRYELTKRQATVDDNIEGSIGSGSNINNKDTSSKAPSHTYVEGESFDDDIAEIEAMGGDPFFMDFGDDDDEEDKDNTSDPDGTEGDDIPASSILSDLAGMGAGVMDVIGNVEERYSTDGKGPTPKSQQRDFSPQFSAVEDNDWEWDGSVNEEAHFDFD
mmetsp:Transcript_4838/g.6855  ORF Transcript_4838/g.6855 Transcript_4838/m.6855 type:complete len:197 (+) Transcript_4838:261-851(+)